jgi:N-acyl-D-aspartate/D-glutamate deacylase
MLDLVIEGGTIVDGLGGAPRAGDVAVQGGRIVAVGGRVSDPARRVVKADGLLVTPGFVDIHTHYDGQATWDEQLDPSASHGVTTAVMGNCGVGFAPVRPGGEAELIQLMEGVEDIPGAALSEGIQWSWSSFPQYLDALSRRRYAMDVGAQIPHGAIRPFVMGERGLLNKPASEDEIARMADLVRDAVRAGALGVSTSRSEAHESVTGEPVPGTFAEQRELVGLARGLQAGGGGVFQAIPTLVDGYEKPGVELERTTTAREVEMLGRVSALTGCTVTFLLLQNSRWPDGWREALAASDAANAAGAKLVPQVAGRPIGTLIGLSGYHLFLRRPTYMKLAGLPLAARVAEMRKPEVRAQILAEDDLPPASASMIDNMHLILRAYLDNAFPLGESLNYDPGPQGSITALAKARGVSPMECIYDEFLADDGEAFVTFYVLNYHEKSFAPLHGMLTHAGSVLGLGDGGAHTRFTCDASVQTFMLAHWARPAAGDLRLSVQSVVRKQTYEPARLYGLSDRGVLAPGMRADLNLIDFDRLRLHKPQVHYDLPAGGARILQRATGYVATYVAGVQTRADDQDTGERPGRLVRRANAA